MLCPLIFLYFFYNRLQLRNKIFLYIQNFHINPISIKLFDFGVHLLNSFSPFLLLYTIFFFRKWISSGIVWLKRSWKLYILFYHWWNIYSVLVVSSIILLFILKVKIKIIFCIYFWKLIVYTLINLFLS